MTVQGTVSCLPRNAIYNVHVLQQGACYSIQTVAGREYVWPQLRGHTQLTRETLPSQSALSYYLHGLWRISREEVNQNAIIIVSNLSH